MHRRPIPCAGTLLLAFLPAPAPAQQFGPPQPMGSPLEGQNTLSVEASDLDGDGDADLLAAVDGYVVWCPNIGGPGAFGPMHVLPFAPGLYPVSASAGDLDGDGDLDVLTAPDLVWLENADGLGTFSPHLLPAIAAANSARSADLDGDGDLDLLATPGGLIRWYENLDGLANFAPRLYVTSSLPVAADVLAADLDGDGDSDLLAFDGSPGSYDIRWYENTDGLGTFGSERIVAASGPGPLERIQAADMDGDGDLDVLAASSDLVWHENRGGLGTFPTVHSIDASGTGFRDVVAVDLDADGDLDVAAAHTAGTAVAWWENLGNGTSYAPPANLAELPKAARTLFAGDLDGDGDPDLVHGGPGFLRWSRHPDGSGTPASHWPQFVVTTRENEFDSMEAADLDGDGDLDVLSTGSYSGDLLWFRNADGFGAMVPAQDLTAPGPLASSAFASEALPADLNGDGDLDVIAGDSLAGELSWYEQTDDDGVFAPGELVAAMPGRTPELGRAADLDRDGDLDVLVTWTDPTAGASMEWLENDGTGAFGPAHAVSAAPGMGRPFAADLDADGDADVVYDHAAGIAWLENDGSGGFGSPVTVTTDVAELSAVVDLDGEGDLDLLALSSLSLVAYEHLDAQGGFDPRATVLSALAETATPADLDDDGDLDVLTQQFFQVSWVQNPGGLGAPWTGQPLSGALYRGAADLDGDGDEDLFGSHYLLYSTDGATWFENRVCCGLTADVASISLSAGGTQTLDLDAGPNQANQLYLLLTTAFGSSPGFALVDHPLKLPLNYSPLLLFTALNPNLIVANSFNFLDGAGRATATYSKLPGSDPNLAGLTLHHAYLVFGLPALDVRAISPAAAVTLTP